MDKIKRIKELKEKHNAVIIAHNYQLPEIQDIADHLGDSLELSRLSADLKEDIIIFCGVRFMAETAKILSPEKTVLLPDMNAGCAMAEMTEPDKVIEMKAAYPDAGVVTYVNTTADIKAVSDICCTSANAARVVNSLNADRIIFVPDRNLAAYVQSMTDKVIIPYDGFCYVHNQFTIEQVLEAKKRHPNAVLFVHPEVPRPVQEAADYILSTGGMLKKAGEIDREIIVGTEREMAYRLHKAYPDKTFHVFNEDNPPVCRNMKKITIDSVLNALEHMEYQIEIEENIRKRAFNAIVAMLNIS